MVSLLPVHSKQSLNMGDLDSLASNNYSLPQTLLDDLPHTGVDSSRDLSSETGGEAFFPFFHIMPCRSKSANSIRVYSI